jgi:formate dehydrogenase subunit gamma
MRADTMKSYRTGWLAVMLLALSAFVAADVANAQSSVRPPAGAVQNATPPKADANEPGGRGAVPEADLWGGIRKGAQGSVTIPDKKAGVLVQSGGEAWRNFRNGPLVKYGAYAMGGMLVLLGLFYLLKGKIRIEAGWSGRTIQRFTNLERMGHWLLASSFIILAITGLNVLYGRDVLMPVLGKEAFASLSMFFKWLHNYVAFAFMVGLALTFVMWLKHNFPNMYDVKWLLKGGGMFSRGHEHLPAKKFNAGQKILFWLIMLGGVSISLSGWALLYPFTTGMFAKTFAWLNVLGLGLPTTLTPMQEQQFAALWHSIMAIFLVCVIFGHIYIGTIGMQGAFDAMGNGQVDENWAREHHSVWAEEEMAKTINDVGIARKPQPAE